MNHSLESEKKRIKIQLFVSVVQALATTIQLNEAISLKRLFVSHNLRINPTNKTASSDMSKY